MHVVCFYEDRVGSSSWIVLLQAWSLLPVAQTLEGSDLSVTGDALLGLEGIPAPDFVV